MDKSMIFHAKGKIIGIEQFAKYWSELYGDINQILLKNVRQKALRAFI